MGKDEMYVCILCSRPTKKKRWRAREEVAQCNALHSLGVPHILIHIHTYTHTHAPTPRLSTSPPPNLPQRFYSKFLIFVCVYTRKTQKLIQRNRRLETILLHIYILSLMPIQTFYI